MLNSYTVSDPNVHTVELGCYAYVHTLIIFGEKFL